MPRLGVTVRGRGRVSMPLCVFAFPDNSYFYYLPLIYFISADTDFGRCVDAVLVELPPAAG